MRYGDKMKALVYTTSNYNKKWVVEVDGINDLFKILDDWKAKKISNYYTNDLVIRRFEDKEKLEMEKDNKPVCDIRVEIYDDYRE